ncbi:Bug family tripartite tricarboxylate transporter substrate binding protein [uncultured Enterovirga sp.]|uniref:Bug family tripartite tricarboxylate transporter substrate binding protein n=1 Tax=uncultured Enterovirga sp. TaxID=2026352 RepID=UPI0035CB5ED0
MVQASLSRRLSAVLGLASLLAYGLVPARAEGPVDYPTRPVRLVVGFAAGGGNDILARVLGEKLATRLGQPVVVENKPGAGGVLAATSVMREPPDGYTLLVGASGAMSIAPAVYTRMNYETLKNFAPVSLFGTYPLILVVGGETAFRSVAEFIDWTKANASKGNYATSSPSFTLATELFKMKTGADLQRVTYRSSNDAVVSVLGKQTTATLVETLPAMSLVQDGKLRALATTATARLPELPDVPTMAEAGIPGMEVTLWTGLFAPAGTPPAIIAKLEDACRKILTEPDVRERLRSLSTDAVGSSAGEFAARIASDIQAWTAVAKAADVKIDP